MHEGELDRRVQFLRGTMADDGLSSSLQWNAADVTADHHGTPVWAKKKEISDGERWRAGSVEANLTTRFVVRWSNFTAALTAKDRLICEGVMYNIVGIKEIEGRRQWLEITAARING